MRGNVWFVIPLLSVNKLINTYSVYDVWDAYVTGRVTVYCHACDHCATAEAYGLRVPCMYRNESIVLANLCIEINL